MAEAASAPRTRLAAIDGLRGWLLMIMALGHVQLAGGALIQRLHPGRYGFADAAYGFVLLSGMMTGLVYGRRMQRDGVRPAARQLLRRAGLLYLYAVGLIVILVGAAQVLPDAVALWGPWLGPLVHPNPGALAAALLLLQHVEFGDILTPYIVYLLLAPALIWACLQGRAVHVLIASGALWLLVQFGLLSGAAAALAALLHAFGPDLYLPEMFNLAAWQFVFVCGLLMGMRTLQKGTEVWSGLLAPRRRLLFGASLAIIALSAAVNLGTHFAATRGTVEGWLAAVDPLVNKHHAATFALIETAAAAYALGWLAYSGRRLGGIAAACSRLLDRVLKWSYAQRLGRASLLVYAWHVLLVYAVTALDGLAGPFPEPVRSLIVLAVIALLGVPTWLKRPKPQPAPAAQPA